MAEQRSTEQEGKPLPSTEPPGAESAEQLQAALAHFVRVLDGTNLPTTEADGSGAEKSGD